MPHTTHIQSNESRNKVLSYFCLLICIATITIIPLYLYLKTITPIIVSLLTSVSFLIIYFLNKRGYYAISRIAVLFACNAGVIYFSLFLGFNSGIYLYILAAPVLIYLLYDYQERSGIALSFSIFILTFCTIYFFRDETPFGKADVSDDMNNIIFTINLLSTLVMVFYLVIFFANNNHQYIVQLKARETDLKEEINRRTESEEKLQKALKERELLLAEIHHRVKNNLSIISALLNMESSKLDDPKSQEVISKTRDRIYAISMVHNLLYQNPSLQEIDMIGFFSSFCSNIAQGFGVDRITIEQDIHHVNVSIQTAVPMALLLNELITNSFKHAFPDDRKGRIKVGLEALPDGGFLFYVNDDGIGMEDSKLKSSSTGMSIIHSLVEQLDARLDFSNEGGSHFTVTKRN